MRIKISLVIMLLLFIFSWSKSQGQSYDNAKDKFQEFQDEYNKIRSLNVDEEKRLVDAVCSANDKDRASVARDVASRIKDEMNREYDNLTKLHDDAKNLLNAVAQDESNENKDDAKNDLSRLDELFERIDRLTEGVRGSANPVQKYLLDQGNEAHKIYCDQHGCDACEVKIANGRADCLKIISDDVCEVIEVKANNSSSIADGREEARAYAEVLNKSSDEFNRLLDATGGLSNSKFKNYKGKFKARVACYQLCPEIDDDGQIKSTSMGWNYCD